MNPSALASICLALALLTPAAVAGVQLLLRGRAMRLAAPLALAAVLGSMLFLTEAWACRTEGAATGCYFAGLSGPGWPLMLRLDGLALPFVANLMGVAVLAVWYAQGYMRSSAHLNWFYALLLLFIDGMLGGLLADDLILLLVAWEVMLLASSLLLLQWGDGQTGKATLRYFVYTQAGSLLLMMAVAWLAAITGSTSPGAIAAHVLQHGLPGLPMVSIVLLLGFGVKMALFPLHGWLPDAHAVAPMPVTVLLAAAMLSLGAYGIVRFVLGMLGAEALAWLQVPLLLLALISQAYGALMSLASRDIKRIVAYSSVSQMGYVLFGVAVLSPLGLTGSLMHVVNHGVIKALLLMLVGLVIHTTGRREIEQLGGLAQRRPWLMGGLALGALAIAGLPPLLAFSGEWRLLMAGLQSAHPWLGVLAFASPVLTAAYALALVGRLAFGSEPQGLSLRPTPRSMVTSTAGAVGLLLILSLLGGPMGRWVEGLISGSLRGLL